MALPIAAIVAAGTTAYDLIQRSKIQSGVTRATSALTNRGISATGVFGRAVASGIQEPMDTRLLGRAISTGTRLVGGGSMPSFSDVVSGASSRQLTGGRRRGRRMNACNVKALRRAGRRMEAFVRLAKSLVSMPGARPKFQLKGRRKKRC